MFLNKFSIKLYISDEKSYIMYNVTSKHEAFFFFVFSRVELKKVTEIFSRMFHDPHSKASRLFLVIVYLRVSACMKICMNMHMKFKFHSAC